MRKRLIDRNTPAVEEIRKAVRECRSAEERDRLRGALWLMEGVSVKEVAERLGVGRNTPARWARRLAENGVEGAADRKKTGRKPLLTEKQKEQIRRALDRPPMFADFDAPEWNGRLLARFIEKRWGVKYGKSQVYRLFDQLTGAEKSAESGGGKNAPRNNGKERKPAGR